MNYDDMFQYVYKVLNDANAIKSKKKESSFRNRYLHTKRVYSWCLRLMKDYNDVNEEILLTSAIFHDAGYSVGKENHAFISSLIFEEYAKNNNFDPLFISIVSKNIKNHSDKSLIKNKNSSIELILLLEADLLDEEGAMGISWDLMALGFNRPNDYEEVIEAINKHSAHILNQDYMVTPLAKKYWEEKKKFVNDYINEIKRDLFLEE